MNRNMLNHFAVNPVNMDISRSVFNMPSSIKMSFNVGQLIPFYAQEVLPGDTWSIDTSKVVRLQPLVTALMENMVMDTYYFFVPNRLVWNHWVNFMGENTESKWTPTVEYTTPKIRIPDGGFDVGTIADYLGVPPKQAAGEDVLAFPFRAYALICDQWFRDENLQDPVHVTVDDTTITGVNTGDQVTDIEKGGLPFVACKIKDYFTSSLPAPQKGPNVTFNLAGVAPVFASPTEVITTLGDTLDTNKYGTLNFVKTDSDGKAATFGMGSNHYDLSVSGYGRTQASESTDTHTFDNVYPNNLFADMGSISQFSINELRTAFAVQRYYERLARGGSRYIEVLKSLYNIDSPDARLQRAEYLGGNRIPINVDTSYQSSATEESLTPQGNPVGISHTGDVNSDFTKSFTEHGWLIGVTCVRYNHSYQNGINRQFLRNTIWDYYNPIFANLGEQAVKEAEIYFTSGSKDVVFGYQEAWAEYRSIPNRVAGEMRSVSPISLDAWHLADNYNSAPSLSSSWIQEDKTNLDRALAVTSSVSNQIIADFYVDAEVARPMPLYSIPGLIDHH